MSYFMGIDVGTSSVKSLIMDDAGGIVCASQRKYDVLKPFHNYAEQDVNALWQATKATIQELTGKYPEVTENLGGISFSGQMHGLVVVDRTGTPLRNLIVWSDQRSIAEISEIYRLVLPNVFNAITLNTLSTGYLISSLMWVRNHEPGIYEKTASILLPKDYIRFKMCGGFATDMSDASSGIIFDTAGREWAWTIIDALSLRRDIFPECHESYELAGQISASCAAETGLKPGIPVTYGGGDTLMHEVGTGMIRADRPWVANIGTSCQVTCAMNQPLCDEVYRTNTFCHVKEDLWMLMSANLAGGAAMKWMMRDVMELSSFEEMNALAERAPVGCGGLIFLPYLSGGRSPDNDPRAKAVLMGLNMSHKKAHLIRSTMEGVIYSLKQSMNILKNIVQREPEVMIASGGGARGELFLQMEADAFNKPMYTTVEAEQSCIGAAATAAVGVGYFRDYEEACARVVHFNEKATLPIREHVEIYNQYYELYVDMYGHMKDLFWRYPT